MITKYIVTVEHREGEPPIMSASNGRILSVQFVQEGERVSWDVPKADMVADLRAALRLPDDQLPFPRGYLESILHMVEKGKANNA